MFNENNLSAPLTENRADEKSELIPEEIGDLTIEEVFEKLGIREPEPEEITNIQSYMRVQAEIMQKLIDAFHDEETAILTYQKKLAQEFKEKYRHGF